MASISSGEYWRFQIGSDGDATPDFSIATHDGTTVQINLGRITEIQEINGEDVEVVLQTRATTVQDVVGQQTGIEHRDLPEDDPTRRRPDTTLALDRLGWSPVVDLKDGLETTRTWFEEAR